MAFSEFYHTTFHRPVRTRLGTRATRAAASSLSSDPRRASPTSKRVCAGIITSVHWPMCARRCCSTQHERGAALERKVTRVFHSCARPTQAHVQGQFFKHLSTRIRMPWCIVRIMMQVSSTFGYSPPSHPVCLALALIIRLDRCCCCNCCCPLPPSAAPSLLPFLHRLPSVGCPAIALAARSQWSLFCFFRRLAPLSRLHGRQDQAAAGGTAEHL